MFRRARVVVFITDDRHRRVKRIVKRDLAVDRKLEKRGWSVVRLFDHQVAEAAPEVCVAVRALVEENERAIVPDALQALMVKAALETQQEVTG